MRYKNRNCLLKIALIVVTCVLILFVCNVLYATRKSYLDKLATNDKKIKSFDSKIKEPRLQVRQNGEFWILENYIIASKQFEYLESITYTTHGEYTFLDNLEEVAKRWQAPISVAIFAPSSDFYEAITTVDYLRSCSPYKQLIRDLVTFHIYFPSDHMPSFIPRIQEEFRVFSANCSELHPFIANANESYRRTHSILYPINVARNIARRLARTHYIFPCDIEMYPTLNFVKEFLNLISRKPELLLSERQVYPLAVFEVEENQEIPNTKADLRAMIDEGKAIPFHLDICMDCHAIPELERWIITKESEQLDIFLVAKHHNTWEPFYVTTNLEPFFDERYTWEGQHDKQIQADLLSYMNYDFCILDNAFLVHRPGIKTYVNKNNPEIERMKHQTANVIVPQLKTLYGNISRNFSDDIRLDLCHAANCHWKS